MQLILKFFLRNNRRKNRSAEVQTRELLCPFFYSVSCKMKFEISGGRK